MKKKRALIGVIAIIVAGIITLSETSAATIKGKIVSERIRQFSNFVVYIKYTSPGLFTLTEKTATSVQKDSKILPAVLPILRNMNVVFVNNDSNMHNLHTGVGGPIDFNYGIPPNSRTRPVNFPTEGETILLCNIHPEMIGYVLVLQNPFFSKVDEKGNFTIGEVPKGKYELMTWHNEFISRTQVITVKNASQTVPVQFTY